MILMLSVTITDNDDVIPDIQHIVNITLVVRIFQKLNGELATRNIDFRF